MSKNPNLIFIMTDHQRADSIGMIQDGKEVTPNLNRMAKEATHFTSAYNACPLCVPARTALATGKAPISNGVVLNDFHGKKAGDYKPIHQYLHEAEYKVGHVGVHHIRIKPTLQERVNFDLWISEEEYNEFANNNGVNTKRCHLDGIVVKEKQENEVVEQYYSNTRASVFKHDKKYFKDIFFRDKAIEFISKQNDEPFALFVYFWAPHPPLIVPEPYASKFNADNLNVPSNVGITTNGEPSSRRRGVAAQMAEGISMDEWKKTWAAHLGLVNLADDCVGKIFNALKESGKEGDTIIVFTSDHGEHLGQHSMYQKMEMYDQAIRVPLLIKAPGANQQVIDTPVSHLDVVPTLLDFVGINIQDKFQGDSLKECIIDGKKLKEKDVFCQYSGNSRSGDIRRAVISGKYKYIYDGEDVPELFDLEEDPLEMTNLAFKPLYDEILSEMHKKCKKIAKEQGDWMRY
ncbi:sulfatase family protein [Clostridium grantii]|uniref:Arylsulfatase A n=1 Tax=Clostridium grantii DSM 8605 TaxID=1121316 RepID=A0A1M5Y0H1_9CLOT|nr:sulfatase-like hydrolase/transferase [Clostridium grantii]SHI05466.1 Arylsulfatase A [Clostridium grantii DSM 8605]